MKVQTAKYNEPLDEFFWAELMTVEEFIQSCESGVFNDYDGFGNPVKAGFVADLPIYALDRDHIPADATHILWFNR